MTIAARHPRIPLALITVLLLFLAAGCRETPPAETGGDHPDKAAGRPNSVRLTEEAVRTGGIAVEPARMVETARCIEGVGELEFNSRRLVHLTARASGRLESIAAFQGERVREGQVVAEIYSRDYLAFQAEVLQAAERAARLQGTADGPAARAFLDAARANLLPLGVSEAEIDTLISTKSPRRFLVVRAPFGGRIIEQAAVAGDGSSRESRSSGSPTCPRSGRAFGSTKKTWPLFDRMWRSSFRTQAFPGESSRAVSS